MKSDKLQKLVSEILTEHKAIDVVTLNVKKLTNIADYMIICSGTSGRHVNAIANNLATKIKQQGIRPLGIEEEAKNSWTLVDLGDVIVHIMLATTRETYDLEQLWKVKPTKKSRN